MLKPRFRYTNKIVRLLTRISAAREVILNSPLIPRWEVALRQEAIIRSAHSSTSIEGNRLSLEQVSDLARGREVMVEGFIMTLYKVDDLVDDFVEMRRILSYVTEPYYENNYEDTDEYG